MKQTSAPVCVQDTPCDGLARGVTLVFVRAGHRPSRVTTGGDGGYRVGLAAGRYAVRVAGDDVARVRPRVVRVSRGRFARVDFFVDTGVRSP